MNKSEARQIVNAHMGGQDERDDHEGIANQIDAYMTLKMPVPQTLCNRFAAAVQEASGDRHVAIVQPYKGRVRTWLVRKGHERRFKQMLDDPQDATDAH